MAKKAAKKAAARKAMPKKVMKNVRGGISVGDVDDVSSPLAVKLKKPPFGKMET